MLIREMLREDLEQVAAIEKECFGTEAWSLNAFSDALSDPNAFYLCAVELEDSCTPRIMGCCGIWQSFENGEIMNVAVRPSDRRKGCAAGLLAALMEYAYQRGICNFTLEVREGNLPAVRLYESLGFVTEGIRKNFYDNPRENALIMWKR